MKEQSDNTRIIANALGKTLVTIFIVALTLGLINVFIRVCEQKVISNQRIVLDGDSIIIRYDNNDYKCDGWDVYIR